MDMAKLGNKLVKVNEKFNVYMYDNGYMVEVGGRDKKDDWKTSKIMVSTVDELIELVREITAMDRVE